MCLCMYACVCIYVFIGICMYMRVSIHIYFVHRFLCLFFSVEALLLCTIFIINK